MQLVQAMYIFEPFYLLTCLIHGHYQHSRHCGNSGGSRCASPYPSNEDLCSTGSPHHLGHRLVSTADERLEEARRLIDIELGEIHRIRENINEVNNELFAHVIVLTNMRNGLLHP